MAALSFSFERRFREGPTIAAAAELELDGAPVTVLFGPSGSGKTTILRVVAGLDRPQQGSVRFRGQTWLDTAAGTFVPPQGRGLGVVFQDYALFPHLSVAANIGFGVREVAERGARVEELSRLFGIEDLLERRPAALSGGQRQRVALARALAPRPRLLLLDEPLSALDQALREQLRGELRRLLVEAQVPALVVTHDRNEALALGDRIAVVAGGAVRQVGAVEQVFGAPADAEIARLVGTENVLPGRIVAREAGLATVAIAATAQGAAHATAASWPATLTAVDVADVGDDVFACIRAEEISIELQRGAPSTARNRLAATIRGLSPDGPLLRVQLDCGFPLVALVTRVSARELALSPGAGVVAVLKAPAVRLVAHRRG